MDSFRSTFDHDAYVFWIALVLAVVLLALWVLRTHMKARRVDSRLDDLFGGVTSETTAQMLAEYLVSVRSTAAAVSRIKEDHDRLVTLMPEVVRHVGLIRFSPFHDTGGDQSFALAILDGRGDGVVVTGLHSRSDSRLYAKPIEGGASSYSLTPEERQAMSQAMRSDRETVST